MWTLPFQKYCFPGFILQYFGAWKRSAPRHEADSPASSLPSTHSSNMRCAPQAQTELQPGALLMSFRWYSVMWLFDNLPPATKVRSMAFFQIFAFQALSEAILSSLYYCCKLANHLSSGLRIMCSNQCCTVLAAHNKPSLKWTAEQNINFGSFI